MRRSSIWSNSRSKPPYGSVALDLSHPLSNSLIYGLLFNERTQSLTQSFSFTNPTHKAVVGNGSPTVGADGLVFSNDYLDVTNASGTAVQWGTLMGASAKSLVAGVTPTGSPSAAGAAYLLGQIIGDTGQYMGMFRGNRNAEGDAFYIYNWDGTEDVVRIPFTLGRMHTLAYSHDGTTLLASLNGGSAGSTASGATQVTTGTLRIGKQSAGANPFVGTVHFLYMFNRALPQASLNALTDEPYAFLRPVIRKRYFVPTTATAATTVKKAPSLMLTGVGV